MQKKITKIKQDTKNFTLFDLFKKIMNDFLSKIRNNIQMGKVHFYNENVRLFLHTRHTYSINCNKTVIDTILDNTFF